MNDIKAAVMPTDSAPVTNDSAEKSHIGEGETIAVFKQQFGDIKVCVEIRGAAVEGVSEKQIQYATDLRERTVNTAIDIASQRFNNLLHRIGETEFVSQLSDDTKKRGFKTCSEYFAHAISSDKNRIGNILALSSARDIIDNYR